MKVAVVGIYLEMGLRRLAAAAPRVGFCDGNYVQQSSRPIAQVPIADQQPRANSNMPAQFDQLNEMLDGANIGVWQMHVPSGETTRNDALLRLLQVRRQQLGDGSTDWTERIHPADLEEVLHRRQLMLSGDLDYYSEDYRVRRSDRGWVTLRGHVAVMQRDEAGKPLRVHGVLFDVCREYELQRRLHAVFDRPFQFVGLLTPEGVLLETNRTSVRESGLELEDVIGQLFWEGPFFADSPTLKTQIREGVEKAARGELVRFEMNQINAAGYPPRAEYGQPVELPQTETQIAVRYRFHDAL